MTTPLVSVVLPVFNGGRYLEPAVRSVLDQDHRALEVIAIDDGSTDGSLGVLRRIAQHDPRLRIVSRENRGVVATLNEGLDLARGDLIARMDADDVSYPTRISRQLEMFETDPRLALCGTDFHVVYGDDLPLDSMMDARPDEELPILSLFFTAFRHSTVMFNRAVMAPGLLRYDPNYPHAEDFDLFRRITASHPAAIIREPLLAYRIHPGSVTSTAARQMRRTHLKILCENLDRLGTPAPLTALLASTADPSAAVEDMARLFERIGALARSRPASERAAYELGRETMFFFFREMAMAELGMDFTAAFLDRSDGWRRIRRREAYMLRALRRTPSLAQLAWNALRTVDRLELQWRRSAFPHLAAIRPAEQTAA